MSCVLVTRPAGQAQGLIDALMAAGHQVMHQPVLAITGLDSDTDGAIITALRDRVMHLDRYRHIIFVSTNAVEQGMHWLEQFWPQWPVGLDWHAVGAATAAALASHGIDASEPGGAMNTEALLAQPGLSRVQGDRVLIVRGVGGREAMAGTLRSRGAAVDYLECYRRVVPYDGAEHLIALVNNGVDVIVVTSGDSLSNLTQMLSVDVIDRARQAVLVVPGERVASLARQQGFQQICVARSATTADIVDAVTKQGI